MLKRTIKRFILVIPLLGKKYIKHLEARGLIIKIDDLDLSEAQTVLLKDPEKTQSLFIGLVKDDLSAFNNYIKNRAYYTKYERFLKNNRIRYNFYDIHRSDWIEQAKNFDVIIWRPNSTPSEQAEAVKKIYILEHLGKKCMPSYSELLFYEDKVGMHYFYRSNSLPELPTFVSHSKEEAMSFAKTVNYPIISKIENGSSSMGVKIIKSKKQAFKEINRCFSFKGNKTYWPYLRQKDYIIFQEFIADASFDLRVIVIGNALFGYYRYPKKGDFRASGAGNVEKKAIPKEALDIAWYVKEKYGGNCLATDLLYSEKNNRYYIIESSIFIGVDTCIQLLVDNTPGKYIRDNFGNYSFEEGKYWIQELALKSFFENMNL